jgi:hypothetical protein
MSRPSKGARLYLKPERRGRGGKLIERSCWIIRDGSKVVATGCAPAEIRKAEGQLKEYLTEKHSPVRKEQDIEIIPIADVLSLFVDDRRDAQQNKKGFDERIGRLVKCVVGRPDAFDGERENLPRICEEPRQQRRRSP